MNPQYWMTTLLNETEVVTNMYLKKAIDNNKIDILTPSIMDKRYLIISLKRLPASIIFDKNTYILLLLHRKKNNYVPIHM